MEHSNGNSSIFISIIEDNYFMREGYKSIFEGEPDLIIAGDYETCEEAFESEEFTCSDVVLMDIELPGMSGIDGVKYLSKEHPTMIIIMITMHDEDENIFNAICAGAVGYMVKNVEPAELIKAIHDAIAGGSPMTPRIARKVISSFQKPYTREGSRLDELTEQEKSVLISLSKGKSYAGIAKEMCLSIDGVSYHIRHVYEKLHVKTRGEAVAKGLKDHLIPSIR